MSEDVKRALEAAVKANTRHRITGVYPTTGEEAVRDIILAFLRAMPDEHSTDVEWCPSCDEYTIALLWPSRLAKAVEAHKP